jgi:glycosyltransferase involved in cell wall biosynthesis
MHVALYSNSRLPARGYGGTQRVVVWLARGLAELGHRVTLLAPAGSRIREADVIELHPKALQKADFDVGRFVPDSVDLLHTHAPLARVRNYPTVFTQHGNRAEGTAPPNTIFLSANHARRHGGTAFVYNGVDPSEFVFRPHKAGYDLFLGRLHSVKGYRWAIEGAKRAGKRLIVAGGWRPSLRRSIRFAGAVDGERKAELLAGAECLWMPALWDEPFGLTLIEAMVSGTPVLGTRRGALPEIVTSEVGRLGDTLAELVELRGTLEQCDAHACRSRAERWFSHTRMAQNYLRMYHCYLEEGRLPAGIMIGDDP